MVLLKKNDCWKYCFTTEKFYMPGFLMLNTWLHLRSQCHLDPYSKAPHTARNLKKTLTICCPLSSHPVNAHTLLILSKMDLKLNIQFLSFSPLLPHTKSSLYC